MDGKLAARFSYHVEERGNFVNNPDNPSQQGNGNSHALRLQLRWTPSSETSVNLTGFYTKLDNDGSIARAQFGPNNVFAGFGLQPYIASRNDVRQTPLRNLKDNFVNKGVTLRIEQQLGDFNLTSISHYRKTAYDKGIDIEGLREDLFSYFSYSVSTQQGQEFRLSSDASRKISGLIGAYYEKDKVKDLAGIGSTGPGSFFGEYNNHTVSDTRTTSYALFGNLKVRPIEQVAITGGVRKSFEKKRQTAQLDYFLDHNFDWTKYNLNYSGPAPIAPTYSLPYRLTQESKPWTWDVTVDYKPTSDILIFGRVARGSRSGGFNQGQIFFNPGVIPSVPSPFDAETVQSYELGLKSTLLDRRLRFNATVFHYDFGNQQVVVNNGGIPTTQNAGQAKIDGGEVEIIATPVRGFDLSVNASYSDARYTRYDAGGLDYSGNRLIQAPKWTLNGTATYSTPVTNSYDFEASTFWSYRSDLFFTPNNDVNFRAGPLTVGNVRVGFKPSSGEGFSINAFVNNVTNKQPLAGGSTFGPDTYWKYFEQGRLYGLDVSFKW